MERPTCIELFQETPSNITGMLLLQRNEQREILFTKGLKDLLEISMQTDFQWKDSDAEFYSYIQHH